MAKSKAKRVAPKRIAGVKVPKTVRRGLDEILGSKAGRKMVGEAILAAGAAIMAAQAAKKPVKKLAHEHAPEGLKEGAKDAAAGVSAGGAALAYAIGEASRSFAEALKRGKDEAEARGTWPPIEPAEKPAKTKPAESPGAAH